MIPLFQPISSVFYESLLLKYFLINTPVLPSGKVKVKVMEMGKTGKPKKKILVKEKGRYYKTEKIGILQQWTKMFSFKHRFNTP